MMLDEQRNRAAGGNFDNDRTLLGFSDASNCRSAVKTEIMLEGCLLK